MVAADTDETAARTAKAPATEPRAQPPIRAIVSTPFVVIVSLDAARIQCKPANAVNRGAVGSPGTDNIRCRAASG
jgi:hypothetical protein